MARAFKFINVRFKFIDMRRKRVVKLADTKIALHHSIPEHADLLLECDDRLARIRKPACVSGELTCQTFNLYFACIRNLMEWQQ